MIIVVIIIAYSSKWKANEAKSEKRTNTINMICDVQNGRTRKMRRKVRRKKRWKEVKIEVHKDAL